MNFEEALIESSMAFLEKLEDDSSLCRHVGLTFAKELKRQEDWGGAEAVAKDVFIFSTGGVILRNPVLTRSSFK